jgi:serine/threonine-protein kinase
LYDVSDLPIQPGQLVADKYRVERVLGVGGMGYVVAALHEQLDQRVAIKLMLPDAAEDEQARLRFAREGRIAAKLKGEHVAHVFDVGSLPDGTPYLVMELLEGRDLAELLADTDSIAVDKAVDYVLQACEALAEAHGFGLVHRDLKLSNLFLATRADGSEGIKVLDFGIAKARNPAAESGGALTQSRAIMGSPLYMAPEQLKSARDADARTDLWALGVILYELLVGKTPFARETLAEICGAILHEEPPLLRVARPLAPAALEAVISTCLDKRPGKRYPSVAELAAALAPFGSAGAGEVAGRVARMLDRATASGEYVALPLSEATAAPGSRRPSPSGLGAPSGLVASERAVHGAGARFSTGSAAEAPTRGAGDAAFQDFATRSAEAPATTGPAQPDGASETARAWPSLIAPQRRSSPVGWLVAAGGLGFALASAATYFVVARGPAPAAAVEPPATLQPSAPVTPSPPVPAPAPSSSGSAAPLPTASAADPTPSAPPTAGTSGAASSERPAPRPPAKIAPRGSTKTIPDFGDRE